MIQARAVGNAVFVEREGMAGDYCQFGLSTPTAAADIAEAINSAIRDAVAVVEEECEDELGELQFELEEAEVEVKRLKEKVERLEKKNRPAAE